MTELLNSAKSLLKTLPAREQDAKSSIILEELEMERRWDESFSRSPDLLGLLAGSAIAEYHAGKTQELNLETLLE